MDPVNESIVITFGGDIIARADRAIRVLETSHPPTYYLPIDAFVAGALVPASGSSYCEWKGRAAYFDIVGAHGASAERAAWHYPEPTARFADIVDHVAIYPALMDEITVNGERVQAQPGDFYGGWITSKVTGPFKGAPGTLGW
jgi:uncharacterized protein (DUF427 family)